MRKLMNIQGKGRRGSTLLIVLAILSLLVLLASTLAYTSKLDVISSENFGDGIQRNMSAVSGIAKAADSSKDVLAGPAVGLAMVEFGAQGVQGKDLGNGGASPGVYTATSHVRFADLSGRVNVNTAGEEALATLFSRVSSMHNVPINGENLAREIMRHRYGKDRAPGTSGKNDNASSTLFPRGGNAAYGGLEDEGFNSLGTEELSTKAARRLESSCMASAVDRLEMLDALFSTKDEPAEYVADIRYPAFGDDVRFQSVGELLALEAMTPEFHAVLQPYITVFSASLNVREAKTEDGRAKGLLDLNRASAKDIYEALREELGGAKDDMLLRQFAVNIVDARDSDSVPTILDAPGDDRVVLGLERTPFITEVYANSRTEDEDGDDGQFVELFNPWPESISLTGWTLRVGGTPVPLHGAVPPGGYLIVTDDYDNANDPNAENELAGTGSFYDIFGRVANGGSNRILEIPSLSITHDRGLWGVDLENADGDLIDRFSYRVLDDLGSVRSFQRDNPAVREVSLRSANPFSRHGQGAPDGDTAERLFQGPRDLPFTSVLELFEVFAGYAGLQNSEGAEEGSPWGFPLVASPRSTTEERRLDASDPKVMDARVIDLFAVEPAPRMTVEELRAFSERGRAREVSANGRYSDLWTTGFPPSLLAEGAQSFGGAGANRQDLKIAAAIGWARFAQKPAGWKAGLVNVNTASLPVLESVGFSQLAADTLIRKRMEFDHAQLLEGRADLALYERLSDVLVDEDLWERDEGECAVLNGYLPVFDQITVNSRAFMLEGTPLKTRDSGANPSSGARIQALIAMDGEHAEIVSWRFIH